MKHTIVLCLACLCLLCAEARPGIKRTMITPQQENLAFWAAEAANIPWFTRWHTLLDWQEPCAHWFKGGELNASYACLDTHIEHDHGDSIAIEWCNERGDHETLTYEQLYKQVTTFAAYLHAHGVACGDNVVIYMPMVPEAAIAMLAAARLGAPHVVVFAGFTAPALRDRILDTKAACVITMDCSYYRGKEIPLRKTVREAIAPLSPKPPVICMARPQEADLKPISQEERIYSRATQEVAYLEPVAVESNHPLFVLYTSGTTGKPKGIIHGTGGYLTYVYATMQWAFGMKPQDVYWCTADIGWITGHSYGIYGPLMHRATVVMREGAPDYPDAQAWWRCIDTYGVSILYTSPTALRMFMQLGDTIFQGVSLDSLRILGSVGEPINPEVWLWYHETIGKRRCPIIDTWWQTETGGFVIAPTAGRNLVPLKPGSATMPMPTLDVAVLDAKGDPVEAGTKGFLVIRKPWPGMAIGIRGDEKLFQEVYWSKFPGCYYTGDYAIKDQDGYYWLLGRADEIIKVAGHRIGTAELESIVLEHPGVAESAAIGIADEIKGEAIVLFVVLKKEFTKTEDFEHDIIALIRKNIGSFATPKKVYCVPKLPKTRSGKIMRRLLKAVLEGVSIGDLSTLEDSIPLQEIQQLVQLRSKK